MGKIEPCSFTEKSSIKLFINVIKNTLSESYT